VEISHNEEDIVHLVAKPNLKLLGPKLGKKLKDVKPLLAGLTVETIVSIQNGEKITLKTGTDSIEIGLDELFIERHQKDGVISDSMDDLTVALDIQLTKELIDEGYAREFINKIQQTRKEMNLNVTDRIKVKYQADKKFIEAVTKHKEYVTQETLMDSLQVTDSNSAFTTWDMNGIPCQLQVIKI
jgi:isoleucyl-tRNA synthetase